MKKVTFLLLLISSVASAQKSSLYNNRRQLIADTSFNIDEHSYKNLLTIEHEFLPEIYNNLKLSRFRYMDGDSGLVIMKLNIDKGICHFDVERSKNPGFASLVFRACQLVQRDYNKLRRNDDYLIYIPVKFKMVLSTYQKLLDENNALTIQAEPSFELRFSEARTATTGY